MLQKVRAKQGLKTVIVGIGSSEILAHSNKPIRNAEDLKGLKYRTSGAWAEVMRDYFGAVPTVVPAGETYTLVQGAARTMRAGLQTSTGDGFDALPALAQIGSASRRERVCQYV